MSVLLSLTLAVPLVCLASLSLLGFVGIMALAGVMHVIVTTKAALLGTGARSLARYQSLPGDSHNPSAFAGLGMLADANQTQRSSDDRETHRYECFAIENSMRSVERSAITSTGREPRR